MIYILAIDLSTIYFLFHKSTVRHLSPSLASTHIPYLSQNISQTWSESQADQKAVQHAVDARSRYIVLDPFQDLTRLTRAPLHQCDQAKPSCTRCQQSGRPCEGYEKYPIFLIRTVAGIEKRKALEEVKPRQQLPPCINESTISESPATTRRLVATSTPTLTSINTAPVIFRRIESAFLEDYLPVCNNSHNLATWLVNVIDRGERSKALQVSLQALAMTRVGHAAANDTLVAQGRVVYGMALRELQVALWDKQLAVADDTLAAARALAFYEVI